MRPRTRCFSLRQVVAGGLEQRGVLELGLTPVVGKEHLQVCKWTTLLEPVILKVLEYIYSQNVTMFISVKDKYLLFLCYMFLITLLIIHPDT